MNKLIIIGLTLLSCAMAANYAVLVAGSNYYYNYRHQSDVCHGYHTLLNKGYKAENIIVMSYNDVANDPQNPFPGKLFNKPDVNGQGVDVNQGCVIDYQGEDVNPQNYLAILEGRKDKVTGGNGRVLESGPQDHVFLSFYDHGAPGLIAFPSDYLYATDLLNTFQYMHTNKKYQRLVYYLEACESGSMFVDLSKNLNIYALSAASPDESSWAAYCGDQAVVNNVNIGSCLGDLFSVNWMEDTDNHKSLSHYPLQKQFEVIKEETNLSQVMQWGNLALTFKYEATGDYLSGTTHNFIFSNLITPIADFFKRMFNIGLEEELKYKKALESTKLNLVNSRDVYMNYLQNKYKKNPTAENKMLIVQALEKSKQFQNLFDRFSKDFSTLGNMNHKSTNFTCYKKLISEFQSVFGRVPEDKYSEFKHFYEYCATNKYYQNNDFNKYFKSLQ
ncbi:peptidase C13 family protein (macronuclear) [Tetrahymena thermophila SB210]|uniref:legumain n=1 Tax=Tetrahymena thermophila (strain SB210) TaxID=312017 RepID=I7M0F6_TETTS|nr:peptidase C13 family protein [Tetrahymena thermophila SB210]EAR87483.2 peptidase C13 family protein [Tetrahymena thermophila SB210]|eukprot:XP_001007728.2 peptidase C13 family protein [Tetrahymena thermophila SB210]